MKEMVNGCCVCSDKKGYAENPLVYCNGSGCNIAVHQACYGIVSVPTGNWYCRKCESQEQLGHVRCELCPSKDGALKRADNGGWAHVVCALYIPEVRFASVTTMEPIMLTQIPAERFNKICYICHQNDKPAKATMGACMQCNKNGCNLYFHVTCAQMLSLLCEEEGTHLDNVNYCGYCQEHYSKLKKTCPKRFASFKPLGSILQQDNMKCFDFSNTGISSQKYNTVITSSKNVLQNNKMECDISKEDITANIFEQSQASSVVSNIGDSCTNKFISTVSSTYITDVFTDDRNKKQKIEISSDLSVINLQNNDEISETEDVDDVPLQFIEEPNLSSNIFSVSTSSSNDINNPIASIQLSLNSSSSSTSPVPSSVVAASSVITSSTTVTTSSASEKVDVDDDCSKNNTTENKCLIKQNSVESDEEQNTDKVSVSFQNRLNAPHMLGNQLNPSSTMAQKMCDTLYAEIEDHSIFTAEELNDELCTKLVGPQLYRKVLSSVQPNLINPQANLSISESTTSTENATGNYPQSLEQLLERQWEQGNPFSMEQTAHFDLASLLAGLHQIGMENNRLVEYIRNMQTRVNYLTEENRKLEEIIKLEMNTTT